MVMNTAPDWQQPPSELRLAADAAHVWRARLEDHAPYQARLAESLSPPEQQRAARFHFDRDRQRFTLVHGLLRHLLGRYCPHIPPARLHIRAGPHGKPYLDPVHKLNLRFNLSHSGDMALFVFARDREVGVDVEQERVGFPVDQLASHFFAPAEITVLEGLPTRQQRLAFFACWTRKEAYIKARGEGLLLPLDRFTVSCAPGQLAALLSVDDDPAEIERWQMFDIPAGPGYAGALVVQGSQDTPTTVHTWQLAAG